MKHLDKIANLRVPFFRLTQPFINLLYRKNSLKLLSKRASLNLNEAKELAKDIPSNYYYASTFEAEKFNDLYGIATILKQYAKLPPQYIIKAHIEHAIAFTNHLFAAESKCFYPKIILCGDYREKILQDANLNKKIVKIGPYINYVNPYLQKDDMAVEKKRLGRNLLVFPVHSLPSLEMQYNIEEFCKKIIVLKEKNKFDKVRVCLFWKDFNLAKSYQDYGFEVFTAGNVFDPLFLPRLRSLIELSTLAITNGIGTHIGYCLSLKVPIHFIQQSVSRTDTEHQFNDDFYKNYYKTVEPLTKSLEIYSEEITKEQWEQANVFCGFDYLKTPEELKNILTGKQNE